MDRTTSMNESLVVCREGDVLPLRAISGLEILFYLFIILANDRISQFPKFLEKKKFSIPNPRKDGPVPFTIPCKPCAMDKTGGCWTQFPIEPRSPWLDNPSVAKSNTNSQNDPNPSHNLLPWAISSGTLGKKKFGIICEELKSLLKKGIH